MSITVELFSAPGCGKCAQAKEKLKAIVEEFDADRITWREVNILEEIDYAVELGVLSPPAIAIDGTLVFPALPSAGRFSRELAKRLEQSAGDSHKPSRK
jgi:thioredoxin 1